MDGLHNDTMQVCDGGAAAGLVLRCRKPAAADAALLRLPVSCLPCSAAALARPLGGAVAAAVHTLGQPEHTCQLWALLLELLAGRACRDHPWHTYAMTLPVCSRRRSRST